MSKQSYKMLLFIMYGSAFLGGFGENLVNMGLMDIMHDFSIDSVTAQWLVTGYMIVSTVMVVCMAYLYRRIKLRALFFTGALLAIVGSVMGLVAGSYEVLLVARLIQGVGMGMFIPMMMNTILQVVPKNQLGTYMSIGGCMISFGPAFAPVVCGMLVTAFGWHSIFVVPLAEMAILALLGIKYVQNLQNSAAHLDMPSVVLAALFLFCLSFGLAQITITPLWGVIALVVAVVSLVLFVFRQGKTEHPLIDLSPMKLISFWPASILVFIAMLTTFSLSVLLPLYFEGALEMLALYAGLVMLMPVVANSVMTLVAGKIMDKRGEWPLLPIGFLLMALGAFAMAFVAPRAQIVPMFVASVVTFSGVGLVFSASQTAGLRTLPPHMNPFGVAILTTCTQIAACVGPSLFVGIMSGIEYGALAQGESLQSATAEGFSVAILLAGIIASVGLVTASVYARAAVKRDKQQLTTTSDVDESSLLTTNLSLIMEEHPVVLNCNMPVYAVMREMVNQAVNGVPLVDDNGVLSGFVSDGDIMRYLAKQHPTFTTGYSFIQAANNQTIDERMKELMKLPVSAICTEHAISISAHAGIEDACSLLANHKLSSVPVLSDAGTVVGVLKRECVLRRTMQIYLDSKECVIQ